MKILIFGKGFLGKRLADAWPDAILSDVRIDNFDAVVKEIRAHKPDAVVNTAGKTGTPNVDWCETHQSETFHGNVVSPLILAEACEQEQVYMLHFGSGCIFYGPSPDPRGWREEDFGNPTSFYSRTKWAADLPLSRMANVGIARLRMPIDSIPGSRNLIDKLSAYKQVIDVENSVTVVDDLIAVSRQLIEKRGTGIFHVVNPGTMRHRDLLSLYREYVDPNHSCEWISNEELVSRGLAAKGRSNCILQSDRLAQLGIQMRPIEIALRDTMKKYADHKRNPTQIPSINVTKSKKRELKGVITAGGSGTRLAPLTHVTNKHLLPIFNKPMILYPLESLVRAGVKDILLTTGPEHAHSFVRLLGSGSKYGCNITYRIQDQPGGIAQAVGMAKNFVGDNNVVVHLGDNIFEEDLTPHLSQFQGGSMTFYKPVADARQYGVVEVDASGNVLSIEEKPENPKSNFAQLGLYIYGPEVFDIIDTLKPSGRGELEISHVNDEYRRRGTLSARQIQGRWFDTGTFQDLKRANEYFAEQSGIY
ncbi:sugar nucleotide-binding protein [Patescibacteria group bacterium]|jgi:glucose-1-phosphate thymidylyltransferase|nr:sugar nucleotide-binding protein [Patescibacteria group bacterium]